MKEDVDEMCCGIGKSELGQKKKLNLIHTWSFGDLESRRGLDD